VITRKLHQCIFVVCCIGSIVPACSSTKNNNIESNILNQTDEPDSSGIKPSYLQSVGEGFILTKNWDFGSNDTIRNMNDMNKEFVYHDQFGTVANGTNYGAVVGSVNKSLPESAFAGKYYDWDYSRVYLRD
jgi:hypothetical protein